MIKTTIIPKIKKKNKKKTFFIMYIQIKFFF